MDLPFSIAAAPFHVPTTVHKGSHFSTISPTLVIFLKKKKKKAVLVGVKRYPSIPWFSFAFLYWLITLSIFSCLYYWSFVCMYLEKCLFMSFAWFKIGLLGFSLSYTHSYIDFDPLSDMWFADIFSHPILISLCWLCFLHKSFYFYKRQFL